MIEVNKKTEITKTAKLDAKFIRQAVEFSEDIDIPENADVFIMVPGGGDWSNMRLDVDNDNPVTITWKEREES